MFLHILKVFNAEKLCAWVFVLVSVSHCVCMFCLYSDFNEKVVLLIEPDLSLPSLSPSLSYYSLMMMGNSMLSKALIRWA